MDWCGVCIYSPPDYTSHEKGKPCGDCWVHGEGNEPTKFIKTSAKKTRGDRIREMTDEELADELFDLFCVFAESTKEVIVEYLKDRI